MPPHRPWQARRPRAQPMPSPESTQPAQSMHPAPPDSIDRQPPTSHTPRPPRFTMPSFPLPERIVPPSLQEIAGKLRSKPIDQAKSAGGERFNWIERLSQWSERHYLMMDVIGTVLLILMVLLRSVRPRRFRQQPAVQPCTVSVHQRDGDRPVGLPSRFPRAPRPFWRCSAPSRWCSCPARPGANMLVLYALYAASAYGRPRAWIWLTRGPR